MQLDVPHTCAGPHIVPSLIATSLGHRASPAQCSGAWHGPVASRHTTSGPASQLPDAARHVSPSAPAARRRPPRDAPRRVRVDRPRRPTPRGRRAGHSRPPCGRRGRRRRYRGRRRPRCTRARPAPEPPGAPTRPATARRSRPRRRGEPAPSPRRERRCRYRAQAGSSPPPSRPRAPSRCEPRTARHGIRADAERMLLRYHRPCPVAQHERRRPSRRIGRDLGRDVTRLVPGARSAGREQHACARREWNPSRHLHCLSYRAPRFDGDLRAGDRAAFVGVSGQRLQPEVAPKICLVAGQI